MSDTGMDGPQGSFRDAMRRLASTVTIISTRGEGRRHGITATAVTSLSMDPPSLLVCINRSSSLYPLIRESERFCVNLLTSEQAWLSDSFAGRSETGDRFANGNWRDDETGVPYLVDGQANIFCDKAQAIEYDTHAIVIGRVSSVRTAEKVCPLIYSDGAYRRCAPLDFGAGLHA